MVHTEPPVSIQAPLIVDEDDGVAQVCATLNEMTASDLTIVPSTLSTSDDTGEQFTVQAWGT